MITIDIMMMNIIKMIIIKMIITAKKTIVVKMIAI